MTDREVPVSLSERRRAAVYAEVDYFIDILSKRYGINPQDVIDAVRWVKERKSTAERLKISGAVALIGLVVSTLLLTLWEGFSSYIKRGVGGP